MPRIDCHTHVIPPAYLDAVPAIGGNLAPMPTAPVEALEQMMDRYAIDAAVVCSGPPGVYFGDQAQADELARLVNEELAAVVRRAPQRFAALAVLPLPGVEHALAELAHALDALALDGVLLLSHVAGTYVGDRQLAALYGELDRRGAYVFVHPTVPPGGVALTHPAWLYELPFETTRVIANLVYSGVFERYPRIRWQFAHLGGTAPFLAPRLASLADREPELAGAAPAGALAYLARAYYDTGLANNEVALRSTLLSVPREHVVFGTDWPYLALPDAPGDPAPGLGFLAPEERRAIELDHARALVPRLVDALGG
jgi:6-methylsalicylate decarboxylase